MTAIEQRPRLWVRALVAILVMFRASCQTGASEVMLLPIARELRRSTPPWDLHVILPGMGRPS